MTQKLSESTKRVQAALKKLEFTGEIREMPESTRTAAEAARAIGCEVGQIAKSLIFKIKNTHLPVLIICSGKNRVDEVKISQLIGETIEKADAAFVLEQTGFVIGGISPVGHKQSLRTFIDEDLLSYSEIWAAAGTPRTVFKLTPMDLVKLTKGQVAECK
ncbi:MAG: YbaK/EbsC family protein [Patescibacteria group bacterium]